MRVLAIADVEERWLTAASARERLQGYDLIVSCGDLDARYLEHIVTMANVPLLYVWGNHDTAYRLHTPEGWEVQPGKTLAVNLEQGHCNVPLARVTLEVTPHALSRARNDLIIQVVSEGRPTQLFIPIVLLASGDYQIFSE